MDGREIETVKMREGERVYVFVKFCINRMKNSEEKRLRDGVDRQPQKEIFGGFHSLSGPEILVTFSASIISELFENRQWLLSLNLSGIGTLTSVSSYGYCAFVIFIKKL
ncbi:hypothetical protein SLA2020_213800 [Shorea laevis]